MLLMIFVNDFWTLVDIPDWLKHAKADEDFLGFSDIIFPAFLFIVGLSIPFAMDNRMAKGYSTRSIGQHIFTRSFALLLMGIFMVNRENIYADGVWIGKYWWQIFMALAFFLIWNNYSQVRMDERLKKTLVGVGVAILVFLAIIFRGGDSEDPIWMRTYWWGILGLIGWAYLYSALIYLIFKGRLQVLIIAWVFFLVFNLLDFSGWLDFAKGIRSYFWIAGSGAFPAFTMAGVVASALYKKISTSNDYVKRFIWLLFLLGGLMLIFGLATRPMFGISKIRATPAWIGMCSGIAILAYAFLYWLIDVKQKHRWTWIVGPAGSSTLTCYLVPYFYYAIISLLSVGLPIALRTGWVGLIKSLLFGFLIVAITGLFNKAYISLKI